MSEIKRAIVKSYDATTHKATVQIAGSLAVWLDAVRVATDIPAADVVAGRQCTVLFLDPANQDDAVIITIQGTLPSTPAAVILLARATSGLTLTTSFQSITGDGDSSKVRLLLPTPGDWLVEATIDFTQNGATSPGALQGQLYVNDSGTPESGQVLYQPTANPDRATVTQRWKVTTTAADTPVELKAKMETSGGNAIASSQHTLIVATGPNPAPGAPSATVVSETAFGQSAAAGSAFPYSRGDHTHGTPADPVPAHAASSDPHSPYALLAGRAGGQTVIGGTAAGNDLTLRGTAHATPGDVIVHSTSNLQIDKGTITSALGGLGLQSLITYHDPNLFDGISVEIHNPDPFFTANRIKLAGPLTFGVSAGETLAHAAAGAIRFQPNDFSFDAPLIITDGKNQPAIIDTGLQNYSLSATGIGLKGQRSKTGGGATAAIRGLQFGAIQGGAGALTNLISTYTEMGSSAMGSGPITNAIAYSLGLFATGWQSAVPTNITGIQLRDIGHTSAAVVAAIDILAQTAGAALYNIRQRGTTGVNRLAANTKIGADSDPTEALDVAGNIIADQLAILGSAIDPLAAINLAGSSATVPVAIGRGTFEYTGSTPAAVAGLDIVVRHSGTHTGTQSVIPILAVASANRSVGVTNILGIFLTIRSEVGQTATLGVLEGIRMELNAGVYSGSAPTTSVVAIRIRNLGSTSTPIVKGLDIEPQSVQVGGTLINIHQQGTAGVNRFAAPCLIGADASPGASAVLELQSTVGALLLPRMTTTQRNALTPVDGMLIYNTTTNVVESYENGAWVNT